MRTYIFCAFTVLLCALGTTATIRKLAINRGVGAGNGVQHDVSDIGVECTPGVPFRYADSKCNYLKCKDNIYEVEICPDSMAVIDSLKKDDVATVNPCSKPDPDCKKTLEQKGLGDQDVQACGLDLNLIIDMSISISAIDKVKVRSFILKLVKSLRLGDAFTLVSGSTYGSEVHPFLKFNTYNTGTSILQAIRKMEMNPKKGTATYLALREAREQLTTEFGRRPDKKAASILVTDGVTNPFDKSPETIEEAKKLKDPKSYEKGVSPPTVFLIKTPNNKSTGSVSAAEKAKLDEIMEKEFAAIPSPGAEHLIKLDSFEDLEGVIAPILRSSCEDL
ncbi:unnamed protein product [Owenia fusiformis]|uniref:VWFA domain-containing protein n=1 Tax=Owenia fusiformis TaxID=6347 RepID=A0A8S4N2S9_OWEFU|nr:unnamed protein product [Owenia fusiformis]